MTPKEKAEELVSKYLRTYPIYNNPTVVISYTHHEAKQCALIAVDEILKSQPSRSYWDTYDDETPSAITFWQEVKQEIEKL